ncbi:MAG TPA: SDR family NAD(P)-dependent oxidoreductase [Actinoplanes sp.]|jgi:NADP-dependent 3-hydroxy acid dehydrogenase YdfG
MLTDAVALITGSSSVTGASVARRLAAEGAAVALVALRRDRLDDLATTICGAGGTALVVQADVTRRQEAVGAVERTVAQMGRLDIVVNNAGLVPPDSPGTSTDDRHQMVALTMQGLIHVTHAALLHLVRAADHSPRGVADLVNVSSDASSSAVIAFSDVIRQEMLGQRVRVSVVESGVVGAELLGPTPPDEIADAVARIVIRGLEVDRIPQGPG